MKEFSTYIAPARLNQGPISEKTGNAEDSGGVRRREGALGYLDIVSKGCRHGLGRLG